VTASVRARLRTSLTAAVKAKDRVAAGALRSAIAAVDNAEAVSPPSDSRSAGKIAGAALGVGVREAARRSLSEGDVLEIVRAEIEERRLAARQYESAGQQSVADRLHAEAAVLESQLVDDT